MVERVELIVSSESFRHEQSGVGYLYDSPTWEQPRHAASNACYDWPGVFHSKKDIVLPSGLQPPS